MKSDRTCLLIAGMSVNSGGMRSSWLIARCALSIVVVVAMTKAFILLFDSGTTQGAAFRRPLRVADKLPPMVGTLNVQTYKDWKYGKAS